MYCYPFILTSTRYNLRKDCNEEGSSGEGVEKKTYLLFSILVILIFLTLNNGI